MTVAELIEQLQKMPQDAEVIVASYDDAYGSAKKPVYIGGEVWIDGYSPEAAILREAMNALA